MAFQNQKTKQPNKKRLVILICLCGIVLIPIVFWVYMQLKVVYLKSRAPQEIQERINMVTLPGKFIHQEIRDNGCSGYSVGLGGGTVCSMSGERMYLINSSDIDNSIVQTDAKLRELGFETSERNFDLRGDLQRFHNEPDRTLWLRYFNLKTGEGIIIIGLRKDSHYTGSSQMPPTKVFASLQGQLSGDDQYMYGLISTYAYKSTKQHLLLPEF